MDFSKKQAIYLQIGDLICENILSGKWKADEKIPSVREMAGSIEVNPNTVMRTYGYLQDKGIIYNQRGIGYFVAKDAFEKTRNMKKEDFINRDLPELFKTMDLLNIDFEDLKKYYTRNSNTAGGNS
jgi:GntR family transcriptional regulator